MSKPTKPAVPKPERTCTPATHNFQSIDVTPRQIHAAGGMGGYASLPTIKPKYLLYCSKCGQGRRVN